MQDFIDQANKNGVTLLDKGRCQFCDADYQKWLFRPKWATDSGAKWASVIERGTLAKLNYFDVF